MAFSMGWNGWTLHIFLLFNIFCQLASSTRVGAGGLPMSKVEATVPVTTTTTSSPPEGNTTFLGGTTWCVALPGVPESELQRALDWACGLGKADCSHLQPDRECFEPNTLASHASFAFNSYYQQSGNSNIACNFGGTATITTHNPSYGSCKYLASSDPVSSPAYLQGPFSSWWLSIVGVPLLLLYF